MTNSEDYQENFEHFEDNIVEEEANEIPREIRKINTQAYDKSVSDIVRMIEDGDINLNPEYQRNYIWDNKKASLLIESIILNVPIPVIYVSQEEDDSWTVIDGLQRLNSLHRFFQRDFKISGLDFLTELNKSDVKNLNPKALRVLRNGLLRIIVISFDSHPEIKYDVFMRLNTGSVKLNEQELRNCLYRGNFNEALKEVVAYESLLTLFNLKEPHNRMIDCELILRYLTISENLDSKSGIIKDYKGRMKISLNEFMITHQNITKDKADELMQKVKDSADKVLKIYGAKAFRRINVKDSFESTLNRALIDILMVTANYFTIDELEKNADAIYKKYEDLSLNDTPFRNSITIGTSDKKVITYRLKRWLDELNLIING